MSPPVEAAWSFLLPYVEEADAFVFTRRAFVPDGLPAERVKLLSPAIDPRSAKNRPLAPSAARVLLDRWNLAPVGPEDRLIVALGRWDRLKDPIGILHAFADHVEDPRAFLVLAGPEVGVVADDPEAAHVLTEVNLAWRSLAPPRRERVQVAALPMADLEENALVVNALQREAAVIVKKSLQEGFGLGVTEGMWKAKPVVATRVGGHRDQIEHGRSGLLVDDPADLRAFAAAVDELLADPVLGLELGAPAGSASAPATWPTGTSSAGLMCCGACQRGDRHVLCVLGLEALRRCRRSLLVREQHVLGVLGLERTHAWIDGKGHNPTLCPPRAHRIRRSPCARCAALRMLRTQPAGRTSHMRAPHPHTERARRTEAVIELLRRRAELRRARGQAVPPVLRRAIDDFDRHHRANPPCPDPAGHDRRPARRSSVRAIHRSAGGARGLAAPPAQRLRGVAERSPAVRVALAHHRAGRASAAGQRRW